MGKTDVLVIGGGISGLAVAWWAARFGLSVEVWEAAERTGGKICSRREQGYLTESAAAMLINYRPEVAQFIRESGLEEMKTPRSPLAGKRRYLLDQGRLQPLPLSPPAFLTSSIWSLRGKLRILGEPFIPRRRGGEEESVSAFITRRFGREFLDKAVEPLIAGTFAGDAELASAPATFPNLIELEQRYGSVVLGVILHRLLGRSTSTRVDTFSFNKGMATMTDVLSQAPGLTVRTGHRVETVRRSGQEWRVRATSPDGPREHAFRQVVIAAPATVAAALMAPVDDGLARLLAEIEYTQMMVLHMGFDRNAVGHPLDGTGFLTPRSAGLPFNGNLWMSSLFTQRAPEGKVLLTSYLGGARRPETANWDILQVVDEVCQALTPLLGLRSSPEMVRIDRHAEALPLYNGAYQARDRDIAARLQRLPGLHLEANYRGGVSVRDRIVRGHDVAQAILAQMQTGIHTPSAADVALASR